jgi:hypothetical protein
MNDKRKPMKLNHPGGTTAKHINVLNVENHSLVAALWAGR